jgi:hypothetical protein
VSNSKARIAREPADNLTPADARDLPESIAFALRFENRKRKHDAAEYMAAIAAERVVRHLERVGFVVRNHPSADIRRLGGVSSARHKIQSA